MMCTRIGCLVDTSALPIMRSSRSRVWMNLSRLRARTDADTLTVFVSLGMESADSPALDYT